MTFLDLLVNFLAASVAAAGFSAVFNIPKKELIYSSLTGGIGWLLYKSLMVKDPDIFITATFLASVLITCISRILSFARKIPITIYLVGGIIPLVPGTGIYYTMFNLVTGENAEALLIGIETLKTAGVIAIGIIVTLSLPWKMFYYLALPIERFFDKLENRKSPRR